MNSDVDSCLHQRTQYCGWHIDHSDQYHQTFVEIAHSRLFSQQLGPSWCHGTIYYRNARCTIYCVFDIRPNRTQFLWDNGTFETTANANTEVRYQLLDNLAVQQQHQPPIIVLLSLSLCNSTIFSLPIGTWVSSPCVFADKFVEFGQKATALQQSYCWYNGSNGRTAEVPYQVVKRTEHSLTTTPHAFVLLHLK